MGVFRHHPDGHIHVDDLYMPLSFFQTQEPLYTIISPWTGRYYEQSVIHKLTNDETVEAGSLPYTDGDSYISKKAAYQAAYDAYLNPAPTLEEAKTTKIIELIDYAAGKRNGKVSYGGNTYLSIKSFLERIIHEYDKFNRAGSLPGGYYVLDHNDNEISFTVMSNLEDLIDRIIELHWECDKVEDNHRQSINVLVSVGSVQSYDFTTGWPTIPY